MPGPIPKRSDQRRRRNTPEQGQEIQTHTVAGAVKPPPASRDWHPLARRWYLSLRTSGQADFYEPSDWTYAMLVAELMSKGLTEGWGASPGSGGSGIQVQAVLSAMAPLLVTEGDRRRARLEIERDAKPAAAVSASDDYRRRLGVA